MKIDTSFLDKIKSAASDSDLKADSIHKSQGSGSTRRLEVDDPISNMKSAN